MEGLTRLWIECVCTRDDARRRKDNIGPSLLSFGSALLRDERKSNGVGSEEFVIEVMVSGICCACCSIKA